MLNYIKNLFNKTEYTDKDINVIFIHGANQTSLSFKYLQTKTQFSKEIMVNYSSMTRFYDNLDMITEQCQNRGRTLL